MQNSDFNLLDYIQNNELQFLKDFTAHKNKMIKLTSNFETKLSSIQSKERQSGIPYQKRKETIERHKELLERWKETYKKPYRKMYLWLDEDLVEYINRYGNEKFISIFYEIII